MQTVKTQKAALIISLQHVISNHVFEFANDHITCHKNKFHAENAL
jgi:hypothetical protein